MDNITADEQLVRLLARNEYEYCKVPLYCTTTVYQACIAWPEVHEDAESYERLRVAQLVGSMNRGFSNVPLDGTERTGRVEFRHKHLAPDATHQRIDITDLIAFIRPATDQFEAWILVAEKGWEPGFERMH